MNAFKKLQQFALAIGACVLFPAAAHAGDETWPCEVVLCMANPNGPTALKECEPPIRRAWKAWSRGKKIPSCKRKDGTELSADEGALQEKQAVPEDCPFTYYATRQKTAYCVYTGRTDQYIDGRLWGRIWYGGPTEEPYIEVLVDDPNNPRPPQTFANDWPAIKADIQAKADAAALAYERWQAADNEAMLATGQAAVAAHRATTYATELAALEASLPAQIESAQAAAADAAARLPGLEATLAAAEARASRPDATYADIAARESARSDVLTWTYLKNAYLSRIDTLREQMARLPQMREHAQALATQAAQAQAVADQKSAVAQAKRAEADAAEAAAQPLRKFYSDNPPGGS